MSLLDSINKVRLDTAGYSLSPAIVEVIKYNSLTKTLDVKLIERVGKYVDCLILGKYVPRKGDQGILFFVGNNNTPVFKPKIGFLSTSKIKPGELRMESYRGDN